MHSAERAKIRRLAQEERMKLLTQHLSNHKISSTQSLYNHQPSSTQSLYNHQPQNGAKKIVQPVWRNGPKSGYGYSSYSLDRRRTPQDARLKRRNMPRTESDSDSGLSCFDLEKDGRPESKTESGVDSGRRTQSLENLSEDLASVSMSSPVSSPSPPKSGDRNINGTRPKSSVDSERRSQSLENLSEDGASVSMSSPAPTPSPRPDSRAMHENRKSVIPKAAPRGQVHFFPNNDNSEHHMSHSQLSHNTSHEGMTRSSSIPVHLTVSNTNVEELPESLRPESGMKNGRHESTCALMQHGIKPLCKKTSTSSPSISEAGTLPRRTGSSMSRPFSSSSTLSSQARSNSVMDSKATTPSIRAPMYNQRGPKKNSSSRYMNVSMQIWEIQKQLKRGEMVQGVLQLGPMRPYGGPKRVPEDDEPCICAPVSIGSTSGHMNWRS